MCRPALDTGGTRDGHAHVCLSVDDHSLYGLFGCTSTSLMHAGLPTHWACDLSTGEAEEEACQVLVGKDHQENLEEGSLEVASL